MSPLNGLHNYIGALSLRPSYAALAVLIVVGLTVLVQTFYNLFYHPLSKVPGPPLAAISDLWRIKAAHSQQFLTRLRKAHARYGPVVRIAPNEVSIVDPQEVKTLYGHKSEFRKGPFYDAWSLGPMENHFSDRDSKTHASRRRLVGATYSVNHLKSLESLVDSNIEKLTTKYMDKHAGSKELVDLSHWIQWFSWDTVGDISFGESYNLLDGGGDKTGLIQEMTDGTALVSTMACSHRFSWLPSSRGLQGLLSLLQPNKGVDAFLRKARAVVEGRLKLEHDDPTAFANKTDMLSKFMAGRHKEEAALDFDALVNEAIVIVVAGADTTMISINAVIRYVYSDKECLARLREELDDAVNQAGMNIPPTYDEAASLPYLQAVIKEGMRMHPAVGMPLQRVVPANGRVIAGSFYPAGICVGMAGPLIHEHKGAYGPDAAAFNPSRWLSDSQDVRNELERFNLTFGQGSRVCIGKNISLMELSKLLATVVYGYDIEIANPDKPYEVHESWFCPQHNFLVKIAKRAQP